MGSQSGMDVKDGERFWASVPWTRGAHPVAVGYGSCGAVGSDVGREVHARALPEAASGPAAAHFVARRLQGAAASESERRGVACAVWASRWEEEHGR